MRRWVSLGGWCGPSLMLSKLGLRPQQEELPFDMVRATMDGIVHFTRNGFDKDSFFPPHVEGSGFKMDPVSIWLLFRGQHTCFTHYNLNEEKILKEFETRFQRWEEMVQEERPLTFVRTNIAEKPQDELGAVELFQKELLLKNPKLDLRFIFIAHEQGVPTMQLEPLNERTSVWALERTPHNGKPEDTPPLLHRTHESYERILTTMGEDTAWPPKRDAQAPKNFSFKPYTDLALIEGVSAFRGTCKGYGSTYYDAVGRCPYCGDNNGHMHTEVTKWDTVTETNPWTEEQDTELVTLIASQHDKVASIEHIANKHGRGAHETLERYMDMELQLKAVMGFEAP